MIIAPLDIRWLGLRPYEEVRALQHALVSAIAAGDAPDTLLLLEHDPTITIGRRRGALDNVLNAGDVPVVEVERGGDATYHGPGQLVGYPLLRLEDGDRDLHVHLRRLEQVLIDALGGHGLTASRREGQTGVWVHGQKLASVGVAVRRWVTYHGFALNVSTDMAPFQRMHPCGLPAAVMASMADLLPAGPPTVEAMATEVAARFPATFGRLAIASPEGPNCLNPAAPIPS